LLHGHRGNVNSLTFTADGTGIVSASSDQQVRLWDLNLSRAPEVLKGHKYWVTWVDFSPDNRWLASATWFTPFSSKIWNLPTGQWVTDLPGHTRQGTRIVFSANGRMVASGSWDQTVRIWEVPSWRLLHTFTNDFIAGALAFSPDSRILAVGGLVGNS